MSLTNVKILLCSIICLTICQCIQSQYPTLMDYIYKIKPKYPNGDEDSIIVDAIGYGQVDTKIAGGDYATLGQFPYMAVVHQLFDNQLIGQCGGTIISKRWVLTAGHCAVNYPRRFLVVFGVVNKSGVEYDRLRGPGVSMITTQAFVHMDYKVTHNDIALLYMPQDIPFSNTIQPIRLASENENFEYRNAFIIGWGKDHMTSGGTTSLKYTSLRVINNTACGQYWRDLSDKHICTGVRSGQDVCEGDSGGPLLVIENGVDVQIGIVSYGDAFCPSKFPAVYTRISSFREWINEILGFYTSNNWNMCTEKKVL